MLVSLPRPLCLSHTPPRPLESQGNRWKCRLCGRTITKRLTLPEPGPRLVVPASPPHHPYIVQQSLTGYPLFWQDDGEGNQRRAVTLGPGHPYANRSGWQYLHRTLVCYHLGRVLDRLEQVHHVNRDTSDDRIENLQVLVPKWNNTDNNPGWNHHRQQSAVVAEWDTTLERFIEHDRPVPF